MAGSEGANKTVAANKSIDSSFLWVVFNCLRIQMVCVIYEKKKMSTATATASILTGFSIFGLKNMQTHKTGVLSVRGKE